MIQIVAATEPRHLADARALFQEYASELPINLAYQSFENELATLPGKYGPPQGRLLLAYNNNQPAGCIALRPLSNEICEMKRLYIRPQHRGSGLATSLVQELLTQARAANYKLMRLDTLPEMRAATALYQRFGFKQIPAYYQTPIASTVFFELDLSKAQ